MQVTPAGAAAPLAGRVRLISPEVDRQTRLGRARVALPEAGARTIGVFARGVVELERRTGLVVPQSAVNFRRDAAVVQVVENNTVRTRPVRLGISGEGRVEIVEGVREGELIVARAGTFVRDGDVIAPVPVN